MGRFVKNFQLPSTAVTIPSGTTAQRPPGVNGHMFYNTTTGELQTFDVSWANISQTNSGRASITKDTFSGDGSTAVFSMSVSVTDPQDVLVFVGGVFQIPTTSYTVSGTNITLGSAPVAPDGIDNDHIVTVLHGFDLVGV